MKKTKKAKTLLKSVVVMMNGRRVVGRRREGMGIGGKNGIPGDEIWVGIMIEQVAGRGERRALGISSDEVVSEETV